MHFARPIVLALTLLPLPALAQSGPGIQGGPALLPLGPTPQQQPKLVPFGHDPALTPELLHLIDLEARFSADVAKGGGKAFAAWFASDGVTLSNGQPAVLGQRDIAASAKWDPKEYQLVWSPEGAQMGPGGDMGFTWGHYDATTKNPAAGQSAQRSGRYITIWKRLPDGQWKVALDASANEPENR